MAITSERLKQTFSEGGAQEIYQATEAKREYVALTSVVGLSPPRVSALSNLKPRPRTRARSGAIVACGDFRQSKKSSSERTNELSCFI